MIIMGYYVAPENTALTATVQKSFTEETKNKLDYLNFDFKFAYLVNLNYAKY